MDLLPDYAGQTCSECGEQKLSTEFAQPGTLSLPSLKCLHCLQQEADRSTEDAKICTEQLELVTQEKAWSDAADQTLPEGVEETKSGTVIVVTFTGQRTPCPFQEYWTVAQFKTSVATSTGVAVNQQKLVYGQKTLADGDVLSSCGIQEGSTISLIVGLFGNMGGARKICFAVDLSGSMSHKDDGRTTRNAVVIQHLCLALDAMNSPGREFCIGTFTGSAELPLGNKLLPCTNETINRAKRVVRTFSPHGGNGAEAACLQNLLRMEPDLIFFLGDGGWNAPSLIRAANEAVQKGVKINSIAFFTTGGGLPEIAAKTGGVHRIVASADDYHL